MTRKPITVEEEIRGRIETIGRQIENFTEEASRWREAAASNEELVEGLTKLRADYATLLTTAGGGMTDLANIQARADAATKGPWVAKPVRIGFGGDPEREPDFWEVGDNVIHEESDAEFIAHARTDVPALLALVREQQAQIERVMAELAAREERWKAAWQCGELSHEEAVSAAFEDRWAYAELADIRAALTATEGSA